MLRGCATAVMRCCAAMPQSHDTIPPCCYAALPLRCYADALLGGGAA
jgi:hypothetical protein